MQTIILLIIAGPTLPQSVRWGSDYSDKHLKFIHTIDHAEKAGMVCYADGGVLFFGYDRAGHLAERHTPCHCLL